MGNAETTTIQPYYVSHERRQLIATVISRPQFVATILKHNYMCSEKDIRKMARSMGIDEVIWPT